MTELEAWAALQNENARLIALLEANDIEWRLRIIDFVDTGSIAIEYPWLTAICRRSIWNQVS